MDLLSEVLIKEGIVKEDILTEIKRKAKERSFVVEMLESMNIEARKRGRFYLKT